MKALLGAVAAVGIFSWGMSTQCAAHPEPPDKKREAVPGASVTTIEAEAVPRGEVRDDKDASNGKYVHVSGEYQPLLIAPLPAAGDTFTVWVRLRGIPVQLKGTPGGQQKEYEWAWDTPAAWKWVRLGRHTRAELGEQIVVIRGAGGDAATGIDCARLVTSDSYDPNLSPTAETLLPNFSGAESPRTLSTQPVAVTVNWSKNEGVVTPVHYGLNLYGGFSEANIASPVYKKNVEYMAPGIVRFHNAGKMQPSQASWEGCLTADGKRWDRVKIRRTLSALCFKNRPQVLLNIPNWPAAMDKDHDGFLDKDQYGAYADLCADLVRIVNGENRLGVRYFEITNERDANYYTDFYQNGGWGALKDTKVPDRWDEVATIYNRCAEAMKRVDPTIRTGGPAAARPDLAAMHERFVRSTLPHLDFFSLHAYASGSAETPDREVYDRAQSMGEFVAKTVALLKRLSPQRTIPVMLDEYNISWTWETRDVRMTNVKGAVFDALVLVSATRAGAAATQAWNEKDGIYGKTDAADGRRPGAELFHLFNTYLLGQRVTAASTNDRAVVAYAVKNPKTKHRSLLLINRSGEAQSVVSPLLFGRTGIRTYQRIELATGKNNEKPSIWRESAPKDREARLQLPADSVTLFVFAD